MTQELFPLDQQPSSNRIIESIEKVLDQVEPEYREVLRDIYYMEYIHAPKTRQYESIEFANRIIYPAKRPKNFFVCRVQVLSNQEISPETAAKVPEKISLESLTAFAESIKTHFKKIKKYSLEEWYHQKMEKTTTTDLIMGKKEFNREEEITRLMLAHKYSQIWKKENEHERYQDTYVFIIPFALKDKVKSIPYTHPRWDSDNKRWEVSQGAIPDKDDFAKVIRQFVIENDITPHADLMYEWYGDLEAIEASLKASESFVVENMKLQPYPYQKAGIKYGVEKKRVLFADEMGLGKTVQAIASVLHANAFPCIVICPKSVMFNWRKEWNKFTNIQATIYPNYLNHSDVIIVNYENAHKMIPMKDKFKSIIVDESHYIKDEKTKRYKSVKELAINKEYRYLLTGTPIINRPAELIPQLYVLGYLRPETKDKFIRRYQGPKGIGKNLDELQIKLRSTCMIRRMKKDVQKDLPDKIRQNISVDLTNATEYQMAEKEFKKFLQEKLLYSDERTARMLRAEFITKIQHLKKLAAVGRIESMVEFIKNMNENGEKVIIFAHHKDVVSTLSAKLNCDLFITGQTEASQRLKIIETFQADEKRMNIILSIRAASTGIDGLQDVASNVVFTELDWTAAQHDQAEDRAHRNGQKDCVNAYYFIAPGTVDETIYNIIERKRGMTNEATGSEDYVKRNASVFAELMSEQFGVDVFLQNEKEIKGDTAQLEEFNLENE
jgi:SWI/SNF-related matrix-associated actin-dependent regulator 1 of chromatin subfamily A